MVGIVAFDENMAIGLNGGLPWPKIPEDFKHFKEFTMGKEIVVGRKTFGSLPPLKGRNVYFLSDSYCVYNAPGAHIEFDDIADHMIICGGSQIYKLLVPRCDELFVTHVVGKYPADTFFPFTMDEIIGIFSKNELVKEFEGGHKVVKYYKR